MMNLVKPGHVLRFATCPSTLTPPPVGTAAINDNTKVDQWPVGKTSLGAVVCLSHPTGVLASICADVVNHLRNGGASRSASYSAVGSFVRKEITNNQNVQVGASVADFVGYTDGRTNYVNSQYMVFSKDFSGCLMVVYSIGGQRRVAHAAASLVPTYDCKQAFLTVLQQQGAALHGWFKPYVDAIDGNVKLANFNRVSKYINANINNLTTFGVIQGNQAYSLEAFRPKTAPANHWVVTSVTPKVMSQAWVC